MITNEQFLEESKKFMSQKVNMDNLDIFLVLVSKFQEERLQRLASPSTIKNNLFAEYFSPALNEMIENQNNKQEKYFFESIAQNYVNTSLVACKSKIQVELNNATNIEKEELESIKSHSMTEIEKLLNNEKRNAHKFHTVIHDYIKDSQEYLYDHDKLALKERNMPSIEDRAKELQKNQKEKDFRLQELEHPKLEVQQFEREMKLLLKGDISNNQITSALKRVEEFQLGFIGALKKKITNPMSASEKLLRNMPEQPQLKALKDWAWEEDSVNVMSKVLKIVQKNSTDNVNTDSLNVLNDISEGLESIMLDVGSLKKYNQVVKTGLLENLTNLKQEIKKKASLKR